MLPDRVSNPGPLTYESGALPIALRGPAVFMCVYSFSVCVIFCLSLIFNRKCFLAKIQENIINFYHLG